MSGGYFKLGLNVAPDNVLEAFKALGWAATTEDARYVASLHDDIYLDFTMAISNASFNELLSEALYPHGQERLNIMFWRPENIYNQIVVTFYDNSTVIYLVGEVFLECGKKHGHAISFEKYVEILQAIRVSSGPFSYSYNHELK